MTVQHGGYLYEQFFLCAPLQLLTQILWHLVQTPLAALTSQDSITSQSQALHRNLKYNHSGLYVCCTPELTTEEMLPRVCLDPRQSNKHILFKGAQIQ